MYSMDIKIDELIRSKRRSVSLEVENGGRLVVRAPLRASKKLIEDAVRQKQSWILQKQALAKGRDTAHPPKTCAEGEAFELLGIKLALCYDADAKIVAADGARLIVPARIAASPQNAIAAWYKEQAQIALSERTAYHAARAGVTYASLKITGALTRWGSCSVGGRLCFTWRLVMAPVKMIDYVVVHELAHIDYPNHSAAFWRRVGELMPDYACRREWFRANSALLRSDFFAEKNGS